MGVLDIWYARLAEDDLVGLVRGEIKGVSNKDQKRMRKATEKADCDKAHTRDNLQALDKLCERVDGPYRIVSQPPIVVPARDLRPFTAWTRTSCRW